MALIHGSRGLIYFVHQFEPRFIEAALLEDPQMLTAVTALNGVRAERGDVDVDRIEEHFASRCRACVRIPWDSHIETGAEVVLEALRPSTRDALLELAAALARGFAEPSRRRS